MSPLLRLFLLGPPVIKWEQTSLTIPRRQVRALLYRLAVETRPLSRSHLGCLFWGDLPESTARRNLSRLLVYLSRNLPDPGLLLIDETHIQLEPARIWVDTQAFELLWEAWKLTHRLKDLQAAVELYRGSFLNGFTLPGNTEFAGWASLEVESWDQHFLKALEVLIDETAAQGDISQSIEYAREYLLHNDLAESVHCRLIELYAALGDRSAALRQYEQCCAALERELGVRPAPETFAAYQAILDPRSQPVETPSSLPVWTITPGLQVPFVGRQEILQQLTGCLTRTRAGNGCVVLISGEAGIGKSRLMQEFTGRQRLRMRVVIGSASPESCGMPYQPLVEALRPLLSTPEVLARVPGSWLAEAARLLPELAALIQLPQPPAPLEAGEARARLFEALCRIIFSLSEGGYTVLLCLDDLQWADSTTLDWLAYFGRRLRGQRVLILGSYRREDSDVLAGLRQILAHQADFLELPLPALGDEDVWRLICFLSDAMPVDLGLADRLRKATGGNPFFILETLRAVLESSPSSDLQSNLEIFPIPASVCQAVNSRLDKLHPSARQVLEAGAVLGQVFDFESILMTAGRGEMESLDGLDELVARQFLIEKGAGYQFCHAIVREAVYAGLGLWRLRRLHRRAGEALEKLQPGKSSLLAWHFEQAGEPGKAAGYVLKAGQAARAIFAHVEARCCFDRALALLGLAANTLQGADALAANRRLRIQVLYERGWALRLLGEMQAYTDDLEEVARLAQALGDPRALAHLHWQEAYNHRWFCRYEAAQFAAEKGVQLSQEAGDLFLQAVCLREIGMTARETGDYDQAQAALEQALGIFTQIQDPVYTIHTLGNLSTLFYRWQDAGRAMRLACQALEVCEQKGLQYERRIPLGDMGAAAAALGEDQQAKSLLEESFSIAQKIADHTQEILCQGHLGWILAHEGKYPSAGQHLQDALILSEKIGSLTEQSWLHAGLAEVYASQGDRQQAVTHALTALELARQHQRTPDIHRAQQLLTRLDKEYVL